MAEVTVKEELDSLVVKINSRQWVVAALFLVIAYGFFEATKQNEYPFVTENVMNAFASVSLLISLFFSTRSRKTKIDFQNSTITFRAITLFGYKRFSCSFADIDHVLLHTRRLINGHHYGIATVTHMCAIVSNGNRYDFYSSAKHKKAIQFGSEMSNRLGCPIVEDLEKYDGYVGRDPGRAS